MITILGALLAACSGEPIVGVLTKQAATGSVISKIEAASPGRVEASRRVALRLSRPARVEEVLVEVGRVVKRGELLVRLSAQDYPDRAKSLRMIEERLEQLERASPRGAPRRQVRVELARVQAQLAEADWRYKYDTELTSPLDGTVIAVNIGGGSNIGAGELILEIVDLDSLEIVANFDEGYYRDIVPGQVARLEVDGGETIRSHVVAKDLLISQARRAATFSTRVVLPEATGLPLGSTVGVQVVVAEQEQVLAIPPGAVFEHGGASYTMVVGEEGILERRAITPGLRGYELLEVTEGLREGESVVVEPPAQGLREGVQVRPEVTP